MNDINIVPFTIGYIFICEQSMWFKIVKIIENQPDLDKLCNEADVLKVIDDVENGKIFFFLYCKSGFL